jgi:hypothetical protein
MSADSSPGDVDVPATWLPVGKSKWRYLIGLLLLVVPLFVVRGHWEVGGNPDTVAVAIQAWQLANAGSLDLSGHPSIAENQPNLDRWYVFDRRDRIVSNRPPGLIGLATPAYLVLPTDRFTSAPATLVALILTTLAVVVSWWSFTRVVNVRFATAAAGVLALGTTTWVVSASELWPHGPGQFWAAAAAAGVLSGSYVTTGIALGLSITTRPITAVFAAVAGLREGWTNRSVTPILKVGALSALGLAAVVIYNRWLFGSWGVTGGYSTGFTTGAAERFEFTSYLRNVLQMFIGATHGFLVVSPIIGVATYGGLWAWRRIPSWAKTLAYSSLAYLLVHAFSNRASGGMAAYYRYPLEAITLAGPFLVLGASNLWNRGKGWRSIIVISSVISIGLIALEPMLVPAYEEFLTNR